MTMKVWKGSSWVNEIPNFWIGGAWVTKAVPQPLFWDYLTNAQGWLRAGNYPAYWHSGTHIYCDYDGQSIWGEEMQRFIPWDESAALLPTGSYKYRITWMVWRLAGTTGNAMVEFWNQNTLLVGPINAGAGGGWTVTDTPLFTAGGSDVYPKAKLSVDPWIGSNVTNRLWLNDVTVLNPDNTPALAGPQHSVKVWNGSTWVEQ